MERDELLKLAKEALELAGKATTGPWTLRPGNNKSIVSGDLDVDGVTVANTWTSTTAPTMGQSRLNAAFIAHAGTHYGEIARAVVEMLESGHV